MLSGKIDNPFYKEILDMVFKKNRNCLIIITGDTGTGKSYLALKLAQELDPTFTPENISERVVCHPKQFIDLVVNKKDELKTGSVIVMDEAGVSMASREWYSYNNKALDYILQTFRYQKLIVIFTVPNMSFVDSHARRLFNFYIETIGINFSKKLSKCKILKLSSKATIFAIFPGRIEPFFFCIPKRVAGFSVAIFIASSIGIPMDVRNLIPFLRIREEPAIVPSIFLLNIPSSK